MSELAQRQRLEDLFVAHAAAVRAYAARRVAPGDVGDVASEVFVVAWRRLDDMPDDALPLRQTRPCGAAGAGISARSR